MRRAVAGLTGLALVAGAAACSRGHDRYQPTTQTRDQYVASLDGRFQRLDRNNDGAIQLDELRGGGGRMERMDRNGDGEISRAEFTAGSLARFIRADADHDGTVTVAEWQAARGHHGGGGGDGAATAGNDAAE